MTSLDDVPVLERFTFSTFMEPPERAEIGDAWCMRDPFGSLWIWGYEQAAEALRHPDLIAPPIEEVSLGMLVDGPGADWSRQSASFLDGAEHRRQRKAIAPAFSPAVVAELRSLVREVAQEVVDDLAAEQGQVDLVSALARPFPTAVFGRLLGATEAQLTTAAPHVSAMTRLFTYEAGEWADQIAAAVKVLHATADELLASPEGLVARILDLDVEEAAKRHLVTQMLVAGWETTGAQVAGLLWVLCDDPAQWSEMVTLVDQGDVRAVVTEAVRLQAASPAVLRMACTDTMVCGIDVPTHTRVVPALFWANRDPDVFEDGEDWRPKRYVGADEAAAPLTWGGGAHRCLGERLAAMELEELVLALRTNGPAGGWELLGEGPVLAGTNQPRSPDRLLARHRG